MSLGLASIGLPDPEADRRNSILRELLTLQEPAQAPDEEFSGGASPGFLERLGQSFQGGVPQAQGFGGGFLSGLVGGLASQGQRTAEQRSRFESSMERRRAARDAANLQATRDRRAELLRELNDLRGEERAVALRLEVPAPRRGASRRRRAGHGHGAPATTVHRAGGTSSTRAGRSAPSTRPRSPPSCS